MTIDDIEDSFDPEVAVLKNELRDIKDRYENLIGTIFSTSGLSPSGNGLFLNYRAILRWLYANEPVRMSDKLNELYREA